MGANHPTWETNMTAPLPEPDPAAPPVDPAPQPAAPPTVDQAAEAAKWKALARKHEEAAKANRAAAEELEKLRKERMTEDEKARSVAFEEGRAAAQKDLARQLVAAEFRSHAALAGRDVAALDGLLEDFDLSRFVAADGTVDTERIKTRVEALPPRPGEPAPQPRWGSTGQGNPAPPPAPPGAGGLSEAQRRFGKTQQAPA